MVNPLSWYLALTLKRTDIISDFPLMSHAYTELKYILPGFVCRKGLSFTNKKSIAISTLWRCLETVGGKSILRIIFWYYSILSMYLTCMMGIYGPYMTSALFMSSMVIMQILIWFFNNFFLCLCQWPYWLCTILWFQLGGNMLCWSLICSKKFSK